MASCLEQIEGVYSRQQLWKRRGGFSKRRVLSGGCAFISAALLTHTIRYPTSRDLILEILFLSLLNSFTLSDVPEVTFEERHAT